MENNGHIKDQIDELAMRRIFDMKSPVSKEELPTCHCNE